MPQTSQVTGQHSYNYPNQGNSNNQFQHNRILYNQTESYLPNNNGSNNNNNQAANYGNQTNRTGQSVVYNGMDTNNYST